MKQKLILLIDDDSDDREIFEIALNEIGLNHKCITAENGREAIELLSSNPLIFPDYIFLDLNMPLLSGKEFLQKIKNFPNLKETAIIIYTTSSYAKDIEETKLLGATHFLLKPSNFNLLIHVLSEFFNNKIKKYCLNLEELT